MKRIYFFCVISRSREWREGSCSDGTLFYEHLGGIQVSGVRHGSGVVAVVPVFDDRVKEFSEHLIEEQQTESVWFQKEEGKQIKYDQW